MLAVIGGGVTGLSIALELSSREWSVELFERFTCLQATSATSTKLLHGSLRYLEHGQFCLVAESLTERSRWIWVCSSTRPLVPLPLPLYSDQRRSPWLWRLGLGFYDGLSFGRLPGFSQRLDRDQALHLVPQLRSDGLLGAWRFWDGQMNKAALGGLDSAMGSAGKSGGTHTDTIQSVS